MLSYVQLVVVRLLGFGFHEVSTFEKLTVVLLCSLFKVWTEVCCPMLVFRPCVVCQISLSGSLFSGKSRETDATEKVRPGLRGYVRVGVSIILPHTRPVTWFPSKGCNGVPPGHL